MPKELLLRAGNIVCIARGQVILPPTPTPAILEIYFPGRPCASMLESFDIRRFLCHFLYFSVLFRGVLTFFPHFLNEQPGQQTSLHQDSLPMSCKTLLIYNIVISPSFLFNSSALEIVVHCSLSVSLVSHWTSWKNHRNWLEKSIHMFDSYFQRLICFFFGSSSSFCSPCCNFCRK